MPKTIHHLNYISDPLYQRGTLTQLNHHENRHRLVRKVWHGQYGELRKPYREGQEEQLGALGLVVNALVLWNTLYMHKALDHQGVTVRDEDVVRLSPYRDSSFNFQNRFSFQLPPDVANGKLRQLRDPNVVDV